MTIYDFMKKVDTQTSQLGAIGIKGDVMFNSIIQSVDIMIFRTNRTGMNDGETKILDVLHDIIMLRMFYCHIDN